MSGIYRDAAGREVYGEGQVADPAYALASDAAVAATSATPSVRVAKSGSYLWDAQFTGTSVTLQSLGADGATWRDVATRTGSGTTGVVIGQGATVRLYNPNASALTGVSSNLT